MHRKTRACWLPFPISHLSWLLPSTSPSPMKERAPGESEIIRDLRSWDFA
jgi:hypothetical protein